MFDFFISLLPKFGSFFGEGSVTDRVGVFFWITMLLVFGVAGIKLWLHRRHLNQRLDIVQGLISYQDKELLALKRSEIAEKAREEDSYIGRLWAEFDESLVVSADGQKLYNTLDAEHFFNIKTLALGLSSNRLLVAAPSFLVAIGVLGTFVGLTYGLKRLDISADDVNVIKDGVKTMINGAALAFMTSVWGVLLSLIFNFFEKKVERTAIVKVSKLQEAIDALYPRLPAEQSLLQIADASRESKEALQELHERIGDRLQKTLDGVSESMQQAFTDALNNVMAPAMKSLVSNASQQSSQVLEQLVGNFVKGMEFAGAEQGRQLQQAAESVDKAVAGMSSQMSELFSNLQQQQQQSRELTESTTRDLTEHLQHLRTESEHQQQALEQRFGELMTHLSGQLEGQFNAVDQREQTRQQAFNQLLQQATERQNSLVEQQLKSLAEAASTQQSSMNLAFTGSLEKLGHLMTEQNQATQERESQMQKNFQDRLNQLVAEQQSLMKAVSEGVAQAQQQMMQMGEQHRQLLAELNTAVAATERSSQNMNQSSTQLGLLSVNLKQATELLDVRLKAVTDSLEGAAEQNQNLAAQVSDQARTLTALQEALEQAAKHFEASAQAAENGFASLGQHQAQFLQGVQEQFNQLGRGLTEQVEALEQQADEWLRSYSAEVRNQVSERMEEWNKNTLSFADEMKRTVTAISGIVDDLEKR